MQKTLQEGFEKKIVLNLPEVLEFSSWFTSKTRAADAFIFIFIFYSGFSCQNNVKGSFRVGEQNDSHWLERCSL